MIFVTVGTEKYAFDRLLKAAEVLTAVIGDEEIFMQIGASNYRPNTPYVDFLSAPEFHEKIKAARIVISHAGTGTLVTCANLSKIPIMMARQYSLGEHVDNHQNMLVERASENGRFLVAQNCEDLRNKVKNYDPLCQQLTRVDERKLSTHLKLLLDSFESKGHIS